jgi:hypothetical protein
MRAFLGALDANIGDNDSYIGARRRRGGHGGGHHGGGHGGYRTPSQNRTDMARYRANQAAQFAMPDVPGVPSRDVAILPASWPLFTFALANGTNPITQNMSPQCPFRGQRLVNVVIRNGASALLTAPLTTFLQVGMKPMIATPSGVASESFTANSFDTNLIFPPTIPGVNYALVQALAVALTGTDTIIVISQVNGTAVI